MQKRKYDVVWCTNVYDRHRGDVIPTIVPTALSDRTNSHYLIPLCSHHAESSYQRENAGMMYWHKVARLAPNYNL